MTDLWAAHVIGEDGCLQLIVPSNAGDAARSSTWVRSLLGTMGIAALALGGVAQRQTAGLGGPGEPGTAVAWTVERG